MWVQERDTARVAARAAPLVEQELAIVKEKLKNLHDELVASERQRAAAEARYDVMQTSNGLHLEASAAIQSPKAAASASAAHSPAGESINFLAAGLMDYA